MLLLQVAVYLAVIVNVVPLHIHKRSYLPAPEEDEETPQVPQSQFGSSPDTPARFPIPAPQDKTFTELTHQQPQRPAPSAPELPQTFPQTQPQPEQPIYQPQPQQTFPRPRPQPQPQPEQPIYQPQPQQTFPQPQRPQTGSYISGQPQQPRPRPQQFPQGDRTSFGGVVPDAEPVSAPIISSFKCDNRPYGYYADEENNCDAYHHCNPMTLSDGTVVFQQYSHWCSPGTKFSQDKLVCVHPNEAVACANSRNYYSVNERFGEIVGPYQQSGRPSGVEFRPIQPSFQQQPASPDRGSYVSGLQQQQPIARPQISQPIARPQISQPTYSQPGSFSSGPSHQASAPTHQSSAPSRPQVPQTGSFISGGPSQHDDEPAISQY